MEALQATVSGWEPGVLTQGCLWYPETMLPAATVEPIPLSTDANGVIRVAGTRVTLETVVGAFETGATPEEIAQDFPTLRLDDIYAVITYYLRHLQEVEAYLQRRGVQAKKIRREIEAHSPQAGLRERLLARLGR
jgi:uncharacterized protein (DUF433 family)